MSSCGLKDDEVPLSPAPKPGTGRPSPSHGTSCGCFHSNEGKSPKRDERCGKDCHCHNATVGALSAATASIAPSCPPPGPAVGIVPPPRAAEPKTPSRSLKLSCYKCRAAPSQVNLRDAISCASCFTFLFVARIKSALRLKCALSTRGSRVLVGVSGGASSSCLAKALNIACHPTAMKRLFFAFDMVHIDESAVALGTEEEQKEFQRNVLQSYQYLLEQTPSRRLISVPLEEVFNIGTEFEWAAPSLLAASSPSPADTYSTSVPSAASSTLTSVEYIPTHHFDENRARLRALFSSLKDSSDKLDLVEYLRRRLLAHLTRALGYADLLLGTSSSRTAEDLFTQVAKGRGAHLPLTGTQRERRWEVNILYPVREQNMASIVLFNHYMKVETNFRFTPMNALRRTPRSGVLGLNKVTHDFLSMLDSKFSSTVSNILGSVAKLVPPTEALAVGDDETRITDSSHCALCSNVMVAKETEEDLRTRHAGVGKRAVTEQTKETLKQISTCYGCTALIEEMIDASILPPYILHGRARDHRSTRPYPSPWLSELKENRQNCHQERMAANRQRRQEEEQKREAKGIEEQEDTTPSSSVDGNPVRKHGGHQYGLQKQSREDMKASFAEFVLPED